MFYLRDKEKREVDHSGISKALYNFQEQTGAEHAFQVSFGLDYIEKDCFSYKEPIIVPASTFLSQLI